MKLKSLSVLAILCVVAIAACKKSSDKITIADIDCTTVTYAGTIEPIISANCNGGAGHDSGSNDGDFTDYAGLKASADAGTLRQQVLESQEMPKRDNLTSDQLGQIQCWIDGGALNN
jgi:hypothetical protein